jgi:hypothetical protein
MSDPNDTSARNTLAGGAVPAGWRGDDSVEDRSTSPFRFLTIEQFLRDATALSILLRFGIVITDLPKESGGRKKKWIGAAGKQLIQEVEAVKARHKENATCECGPEQHCRRCELSDMFALKKLVRSHPPLLERFLKPDHFKAIVNPQGNIKAGIDLDQVWKRLANDLSAARGAHGKR